MSENVNIYGTTSKDKTTTLTTEGYVKLPNGTYKKMTGLTPIIRIPDNGQELKVVYKKDGAEFDKLYKKSGKLMRQLPKISLDAYLLTEDNHTLAIYLNTDCVHSDVATYNKWIITDAFDCYSVRNGEIVNRAGNVISGDFEVVKVDEDGDLLMKNPSEKFYLAEECAGFYEAVTIDGEINETFAKSFKVDPNTEKKAIALAQKFAQDVEALGLGIVVNESKICFVKLPSDLGFPIEGDTPEDKKYITIPDQAFIETDIVKMIAPCIIIGDAENTDDNND